MGVKRRAPRTDGPLVHFASPRDEKSGLVVPGGAVHAGPEGPAYLGSPSPVNRAPRGVDFNSVRLFLGSFRIFGLDGCRGLTWVE